jgi:hypothetical protein
MRLTEPGPFTWLLARVKANSGQRGDSIAVALGSDVGTIRGWMKKLITARHVRAPKGSVAA